jgi:hypothetical protein
MEGSLQQTSDRLRGSLCALCVLGQVVRATTVLCSGPSFGAPAFVRGAAVTSKLPYARCRRCHDTELSSVRLFWTFFTTLPGLCTLAC